jgi:L-ascorbate metabolism protein UlaG (beta-lactamase superfamily)
MARLPTLPIPVGIDDDADEPEASGALVWLGTSTVLLRYLGLTILTDPCFLRRGRRVKHHLGARMVKLRDPSMKAEALPPIDLVVLTHFHPAHFDLIGARHLDAAVPIVTTTHAAAQLHRLGYAGARGLSTWDYLEVQKGAARLLVTATPAIHGRGPVRALFPPGMGAMLDFESPEHTRFRLWISGDTRMGPELAAIAQRFPDVDLAILHLGGELVAGALVTMDGEQGAEAIETIAPHRAIPVHYDDWSVFASPLDDFRDAVARRGLTRRLRLLARGETYRFGAVSRTSLPPQRRSQVPGRVPSRP